MHATYSCCMEGYCKCSAQRVCVRFGSQTHMHRCQVNSRPNRNSCIRIVLHAACSRAADWRCTAAGYVAQQTSCSATLCFPPSLECLP